MIQDSNNRLGSELCKAIGLTTKGIQSLSVTIKCSVDDIATLEVYASVIADQKMLAFLQDEVNSEILKAMDKKVEIKYD